MRGARGRAEPPHDPFKVLTMPTIDLMSLERRIDGLFAAQQGQAVPG